VSWRALVIAGIVLAGCGRDRPPPPRDAAQACRAAMEAAGEAGHVSLALRGALACERLYRDAECAAAWEALGHDEADAERRLAVIAVTCRSACLRESGGAPPRGCVDPIDRLGDGSVLGKVIELDRAMLWQAGLSPSEAEALAMRALVLGSRSGRGAAVPAQPDPDDPITPDDDDADYAADEDYDDDLDEDVDVDDAVADGIAAAPLVVELDLLEIRVAGRLVLLDDLERVVEAAHDRTGVNRVEVKSRDDVPYERLVRVLDAVRSAGIDDIAFSVRP
jgi:hypothetical protein